MNSSKTTYEFSILILGLFIISSCAVFQSKYVEIETEDGECFDEYYAKILENKFIEIIDSNSNHLTFKIINLKDLENEPEISHYIVKLKSELINYELKFNFDFQKSIFAEKNNYDIYIISNDSSIEFNIKVGTIELKKGEKREIKIGIKKDTSCESYPTTEKILRSEFRKNKKKYIKVE